MPFWVVKKNEAMTPSRRVALFVGGGLLLWACGDGLGGASPTDSGMPKDAGAEAEFDHLGACGVMGEVIVKGQEYEGFEEHYLIGDEGMGEDLCRVRFDLVLVGEPPVPCDMCSFSLMLEKRDPLTITDVGGTCAGSALGLDAEAITALNGVRVSYGYAPEYWGHASVLVQLDVEKGEWEAVTFSTWDEAAGALFYDRRDGACGY